MTIPAAIGCIIVSERSTRPSSIRLTCVFPFDDEQFARVNELFIQAPWPTEPYLVGYKKKTERQSVRGLRANSRTHPLPMASGQRAICDHDPLSGGPVCKGQVALNVINDHFWLLFLDPEYDLSVKYPGFLRLHHLNLRMPIEDGSNHRLYKVLLKDKHYKWAIDYYQARQQFLRSAFIRTGSAWRRSGRGGDLATSRFLPFLGISTAPSVHRGSAWKSSENGLGDGLSAS